MTFTRSLSRRARAGRKRRVAGGLAAAALVMTACGGSGTDTPAGPAPSLPPECAPIRSPAILGRLHIPVGTKAVYNSTPPTSGNHYPSPARVGGYKEPIPNEVQVHNLEHGHVMVQHDGLTDAQINVLASLIKDDPAKVLMAPYPEMDAAVALTSWGKIQTCSAWSDAIPAIVRYFILKNRDNAPESID